MRTKGSPNRPARRGQVRADLKSDLVKFRCSGSFRKLLQDYREANPGYIARPSEGDLIRLYVLRGMLREGHLQPDLLQRIQDELQKHGS